MGLSGRVPTGTKTAGFIPAVYTQELIDAVESQLVCWDAINSEWKAPGDMKKGDTFYFPIANNVVATEVVVGSKASSLDPLTGTKVTLSIDQFWEAPIDVDTMSSGQSPSNLAAIAKARGSYAIQKKIDSTVAALFSSLGGYSSSAYGSDGQTLSDDIMLYLLETLNEADVPLGADVRTLIVDPSALTDFLKLDKFITEQYGRKGAVENGDVGTTPIYGCRVKVTNNLAAATTGAYAVLMHKDAIRGKIQLNAPWIKPFEELHEVRYQHEALWGVIEANDTFGLPFYTRKK